MDLYQREAHRFAVYPVYYTWHTTIYPILGLTSEAGEVAGKLKKLLRGDTEYDDEFIRKLSLELGDVMWYAAEIATVNGLRLSEICQQNIEKLGRRKSDGTIKGDGDVERKS